MEIREITADSVRPIRQSVLRPSQTIEEMAWEHDDDTEAKHFGAFFSDELVGVITAFPNAMPEYQNEKALQFRGMATLPEVRGSGAGKRLVMQCIAAAIEVGASILWCDARTTAIGFYEKLGFSQVGELLEKPNAAPHIRMMKRL